MRNKRRSFDAGKHRKNKGKMLIALAILINIYMMASFFLGEMGFLNANQLKRANREIRSEVVLLDQENERLFTRINALRNDPVTIEGLARERLGLVKEGELVYEFIEELNEIH